MFSWNCKKGPSFRDINVLKNVDFSVFSLVGTMLNNGPNILPLPCVISTLLKTIDF